MNTGIFDRELHLVVCVYRKPVNFLYFHSYFQKMYISLCYNVLILKRYFKFVLFENINMNVRAYTRIYVCMFSEKRF